MKQYNPYDKYSSSDGLVLDTLVVDDGKCELVEPSHPALHKRASLDPFDGTDWVEREKEMLDLMHGKLGVGLASPQIGSSYNMFVMHHSILGDIGVYNPTVLETEGKDLIEEGCLSWPLLYIPISRPERIKVSYTKNDGETIVETWMDGMDARCFLHEVDHLNGVNFIDIVSEFKLKRAKEKRDKFFKKMSRSAKRVKS